MPKIRIDNLPMDRQSAGYARGDVAQSKGLMGPQGLTSVFEKRDIEPSAALLQRRTGSRRVTDAIPNLLGVTADVNAGGVTVDYEFDPELTNWTAFATVHIPIDVVDGYYPLFQLQDNCHVYIFYDVSADTAYLRTYTSAGVLENTKSMGVLGSVGLDHRIMVRYVASGTTISVLSWPVPAAGATTDLSAASEDSESVSLSGGSLSFIGAVTNAGALAGVTAHGQVVLTNFMLYNVADFSKDSSPTSEYETYGGDLTPAATGTSGGGTAFILRWHEKFSEGGEVLSFTNPGGTAIYGYLTPTAPSAVGDWIHFGGGGVIEIPFYLDFDEYYWTPSQAAARLEWMFQIEFTLPEVMPTAVSTIFDFQDILRLDIGTDRKLDGIYAGTGRAVGAVALTAGETYQAFIGRNAANTLLKIVLSSNGSTVETVNGGVADNPAIFNYDKMLGFIVGDTADAENTSPFGGQIKRFALGNDTAQLWQPLKDAVLYYNADSVVGDQIIDRGNRALNSYTGTRAPSAPPFYKEGGFKGGSYVAAVGGYTLAGSTPDTTYTGELRKALLKDAVIQRRGSKAFLTSNGVNYVIDDDDQTFRPLGIPRPATKVSANPQGVGVIDGFVRYAYRWVTKDGTVGPAFSLDPVDARGGVNVFLGADSYGLPGETPFGISWGELETGETGTTAPYGDVEWFVVKDTDGSASNNVLLKGREIANPGLTLEVAARIPDITNIKESIFSQGVFSPVAAGTEWGAVNQSQTFPWIGKASQECTFQFCFRYAYRDANDAYQTLFTIGHPDQHYETGFNQSHWHLHDLVVSIQPPQSTSTPTNTHSIVVCRDGQGGGKKRDNNLYHKAIDYNFVDQQDYCVIIRRNGSAAGVAAGSRLSISIFNKTLEDEGSVTGWAGWPGVDTDTVKYFEDFWPASYATNAWKHVVMWGCTRSEGKKMIGRSRERRSAGSSSFDGPPDDGHVPPLAGTDSMLASGEPNGTILYHGRMWIADIPFQLLAQRGLERYAGQEGTLGADLKFDIAFCSDSSVKTLSGGWDEQKGSRSYFRKDYASGINCYTHMTQFTKETPILAYGWDMGLSTGSPGKWNVSSLDFVPLWVSWSSRNEGSIVIGTGDKPVVEVATKKWHDGAGVQLFSDFANEIDLKSFTWITLYFHHIKREGETAGTPIYDVWLERVFLDGNTGEWGEVFAAGTNTGGIQLNAVPNAHPYGLFSLGMPGMDQELQSEIAEVRLWDGERYTAEGGGYGDETFGPYISTRIPPNIWDKLWYYIRFMKIDLDDEATGTKLDQYGIKQDASSRSQKSDAAVFLGDGINTGVATGAEVVDANDDDTSVNYFVPFPEPPMSSIRGIQIFRTQVVPVTDNFPNGNPNPNAVSDAWRGCRDAPLYYLTEIPRGTNFYTDFADDTVLGAQLDQLTGLIPRNPAGVFEWEGHLGVFVEDEPRIHFAESITSWESFPLDLVYDLPIKEKGSIKAAIEIASRDARQSRVLVLGESWGVFLDGSPLAPQTNTLGGGLGASSARCLVVEKGIAYAYNGTLWAITGDGQVQDIGLPVLDLLPSPANARLSVSSALSSLLVIDESTGLVLRFYFPRGQWFVEDRNALSVTDKDGSDYWVHVSGYPSVGTAGVYQDDVHADTPAIAVAVTNVGGSEDTTFSGNATGMKVGQRITLVADRGAGDAAVPSIRQTVTIASISGTTSATITTEETIDLAGTYTDIFGTVHTLVYNAYIGVGYWGTMLDTGQFGLQGDLNHVDIGVAAGTKWWAASDASDFAKDPTDRSGFDSPESKPTLIGATAGRWGLSNSQRFARTILWTPDAAASGLSEVELTYTPDPGERN